MTDKRIKSYLEDRLKRLESIRNERELTTAELGDIACCKQILAFINSLQEEPVSEDLEKMSYRSAMDLINNPKFLPTTTFGELTPMLQKLYKDGARWQKENLWKPADGDDLPEIDREVVALLDNGKVVFAHRPPKYWDGKNIVTGRVTRHYPKTYDKGGWNIPNVKYWLDVELPKEIEL